MLRKINRLLVKIASVLVIIGIACLGVLVPADVIGRYFTGRMFVWSPELSSFCLVWVGMLGGAVGFDKGMQIGVTVVINKLPQAVRSVVMLIGYLCMLYLLSVLVTRGIVQVRANFSQVTSIIKIPMGIPYMALPVGAGIMALITVEKIIDLFRKDPGAKAPDQARESEG